ncbi:MAG: hypothetical protein ACI9A2_000403, partial [Halioglobus sp.]
PHSVEGARAYEAVTGGCNASFVERLWVDSLNGNWGQIHQCEASANN